MVGTGVKAMVRWALRLVAAAALLLSIVFGLFYYHGYWRIRDCVLEARRTEANGCFDPVDSTTYSGNTEVAIYPAGLFLLFSIGLWLFARRVR